MNETRPIIAIGPQTAAEVAARAKYAHELAKAREKEDRQHRRPVWLRRGFWSLLRVRIKGISHHAIDKYEFDEAFRGKLTSK